MLILTRRLREALRIGDAVEVTVLGINGNQVRLGISAPKHVPVHREEVYDRIRQGSAATSKASSTRSAPQAPAPFGPLEPPGLWSLDSGSGTSTARPMTASVVYGNEGGQLEP